MRDRLMQIAAFLVVTGFVGIIFYHVPHPDLGAVILITLVGIAYDFFGTPLPGRRRK